MPTPESELFLKKKPTVPPTFEGVDFRDYNAVTNARDAIIREQWVKAMMQRLVEEELGIYPAVWAERMRHKHYNYTILSLSCFQ